MQYEQTPLMALVNYVDPEAGELVFDQRHTGPGKSQLVEGIDAQSVAIQDGRLLANQGEVFSLQQQGFELVKDAFNLRNLDHFFGQLDETNSSVTAERDRLIKQDWYPVITDYLKQKLQADAVLMFDHTLRTDTRQTSQTEQSTQRRATVKTVHNDYTDWSSERQLKETLAVHGLDPNDYTRYQFVNVWLPLLRPVTESPMAMVDLRSAADDDFHNLRLLYPTREGQISVISANPEHRWVWFSDMTPEEALLLKVYDSQNNSRISGVPHTAFDLNTMAQHKRISIEIRTIALHEKAS